MKPLSEFTFPPNAHPSIAQWLDQLPEPIREQALTNHQDPQWRGTLNTMNTRKASIADALNGAFLWRNSPQGHDYWEVVQFNLRRARYDKRSMLDVLPP